MTLRKKLPQPSKEFQDARSTERQQGIAYLYACGPEVVLEAVLEVSAGKPIELGVAPIRQGADRDLSDHGRRHTADPRKV